jgi:hypothetical protein
MQMARYVFYMQCKENGEEGVAFYGERAAEAAGGPSALESKIYNGTKWYALLGEAELPPQLVDSEDLELGRRIIKLVEAWIEQGAPIVKGAFDDGLTVNETPKIARQYFFYKICDKGGLERVGCHSEAQVREYGSIEALEAAMSKHTSWFYPIGSLLFPEWVEISESDIQIPYRRIKALVDAWLEQGSPWKPGKFAQDLHAPPKGHPLVEEGA